MLAFMMKNMWSTFKKTRKSKPFTVNKSSFVHQASSTSQHIVVTKRPTKHHRINIFQKLDLYLHYIRCVDKSRTMENLIERSFYYELDGDRKMQEVWSDDLDIEMEEAEQLSNDITMINVYGEPIFYSMNDLKNYYYYYNLTDQPKFTYISRCVFSDQVETGLYSPQDRQEETTLVAEESTTFYEQQVITQQDEAVNHNMTTTTPVITTRPFEPWNPRHGELPSFPLPSMSIHTRHIPDYPTQEEQPPHQHATHLEEPVVLPPLPEPPSVQQQSPPLVQQAIALNQYLFATSFYPAEQVLSPEQFQLDSPNTTGVSLSPRAPPANLPSFSNYYSAESQSTQNTHDIEETMSPGTPPLPESPLDNHNQTEQQAQNTTHINEAMPPPSEPSSSTIAYPPIIADLSPTADEPSYYPESPSLQTPFHFPPPQESIMYPNDEQSLQDSPVISQDNQPLLLPPLNFVGQEWLPSSPPETRAASDDINSSSTEYFPNSSMSSADELEHAMMNLTVQSNHVSEQQNNEEEEGPNQEYREEEEDPIQELNYLLDAQSLT